MTKGRESLAPGERVARPWRRRIASAFLLLVIGMLALRAALFFAAPRALAAWAEGNGLAASYEDLDLSLVTGNVELWHLVIRDRERSAPGAPLLHVEYATVDLDVLSLFTGRARVRRVEVDGLDLALRRRANGTLDLPFVGAGAAAGPGEKTPAAVRPDEVAEDDDAVPTSLRLPAELAALRVQAVRVHFVDESVEPRLEADLELELRVSDLGADARPARIDLAVASPGLLDRLSVRGVAMTTAELVDVHVDVTVAGFHPRALAALLAPLGLAPIAETIEFRLVADAGLALAGESDPGLCATLAVRDVELESDVGAAAGMEAIHSQSAAIAALDLAATISAEGIAIDDFVVRGLRGAAARLADGRFLAAGFALGQAGTSSAAESEPVAPASGPALAFCVDSARIEDASLVFFDAAVAPELVHLELAIPRLVVSNVVVDPRRKGENASFTAELSAPGIAETIALTGVFVPDPSALAANLELEISALAPERLAPYLAPLGLESTFVDGMLSARLSAGAVVDAGALRDARVALSDVHLRDGQRELFGLAQASVEEVELGPSDTRIGRVRVSGIDLPLSRDAGGAFELLGLRTRPATDAGSVAGANAAASKAVASADATALHAAGSSAGARALPSGSADNLGTTGTPSTSSPASDEVGRFELARFELSDTSIRFEDLSVEPPLALATDELDAELRGLVLGADGGRAELSARLSIEGLVDALTLDGTLASGPGALDLALDVAIRGSGFSTVGLHPRVDVEELDAALHGAGLALDLDVRLAERDGALAIDPVTFDLSVTARDTLDELSVRGEAFVRPEELGLKALLEVNGLSNGELAVLLPPGIEVAVTEGRLAATLAAGSAACTDGGRSAWLELSDLAYRDGERSLVALETISVNAPRLDPESGVFAIEEIAVRGLELDLVRTAPGRLEIAGLAIATLPAAEELPAGPSAAPSDPDGVEAHLEAEPSVAAPAAASIRRPPTAEGPRQPNDAALPRPSTDAALPRSSATLPRVTLAKLDVGIERFGFLDATQAGAVPLDASLRLANRTPLVLLDADPTALAPIEIALTGRGAPVLGSLEVGIALDPYADRPEVAISVLAEHIRGAGLTEVLPELAAVLDGSGLVDGRFDANLRGALEWRRRGPTDFDLSSGFGAELEVRDAAFRAEPGGPVLVGVDRVDVEVARVNPATGDAHVRSVEIATPRLRARRDTRGLHVAGIVLLPAVAAGDSALPAASSGESTGSAEPVVAVEARAAKGSQSAASAPRAAEWSLDELVVQGLDVEIRDATSEPELVVPLQDLDLEVKGLTSLAFSQPKPVRYSVYLSSGRVPLPKRTERSLLGGIAQGALSMAGIEGKKDGRTDERALFDAVALTGSLELYPVLEGWTKVEISSLELLGFEGPARAAGVTIGDGVLDARVETRFHGARGVSTQSSFTFQNLALSEASNGPITRYLKLPAPLDAVLFALKNSDGEHAIPLAFDTDAAGGISLASISAAAVTTFAKLVANAVASSPLRVTGVLTDIVGLTGGTPRDLTKDTVSLAFEAADPAFDPEELRGAKSLLSRVKADDELGLVLTHAIGRLDVERADVLANPRAEACMQLSEELRAKKREFGLMRADVAAEARVHYAVGRAAAAAAATERLRAIDRELSRTEDALDRLGELLRRGSERRRDKRTRATCLEIAEGRLESVQAALLANGVHPDRLELRRPRFTLDETTPETGQVLLVPKRR